jgi:hypothetical protein
MSLRLTMGGLSSSLCEDGHFEAVIRDVPVVDLSPTHGDYGIIVKQTLLESPPNVAPSNALSTALTLHLDFKAVTLGTCQVYEAAVSGAVPTRSQVVPASLVQ